MYIWNQPSRPLTLLRGTFYLTVGVSLIGVNLVKRICKIIGCKSDNSGRYLIRGMCGKHSQRYYSGADVNVPTIYDRRPAIIEGNTAKIPVGIDAKNGYAIVDKEFSYLDKQLWSIHSGYPVTNVSGKPTKMHYFIMGKTPKGMVTDHISRDKLDNRIDNLRHTTQKVNMRNIGLHKNGTSPHLGVNWDRMRSRWVSCIVVNDKRMFLGRYDDLSEAISARLLGESLYWA